MKFNKIKIPKDISQLVGIEKVEIERLGNVVAFVGKNGSGKSRVLNLIDQQAFNYIDAISILDHDVSELPLASELLARLKTHEGYVRNLSKMIVLEAEFAKSKSLTIREELSRVRQKAQLTPQQSVTISQILAEINDLKVRLKEQYFRRINQDDIRTLQQTIDAAANTPGFDFERLFETIAMEMQYDEFKLIKSQGLRYFQEFPSMLTLTKIESLMNNTLFENSGLYKRFLSLKKFIKDLLNKDLDWEQQQVGHQKVATSVRVDYKGIWKINGRRLNYEEFSDGEKRLFAYAIFFFLLDQNPNLRVRESVIVIDEPELNLHPNSEIDLIQGLRNVVGTNGQLIIATHSLGILSHLNYEEIFMVKDGAITPPTRATPGNTLVELMGIEERIAKLSNFVSSIYDWTYVNYMSQCFDNPDVIESARSNDPQIQALKDAIKLKSKNTNMLLDFGAGKGRIYEQLKTDYAFISTVQYSALEPASEFHSKLQELGVSQIFSAYAGLPQNSFDFIVLCNVLHEIHIEEWVTTLNAILGSLKDDGYLIIIEPKTLKKGEKIEGSGFILMGLAELKKLFNLKELPSSTNHTETTCAVIPKLQLREINTGDLLDAVGELKDNTLKKIQFLRKNSNKPNGGLEAGREAAFLSQLFINALIAIEILEP